MDSTSVGPWPGSAPPSAIQGARTAQVPPPLLFFDVATGKWKSPMEMLGVGVLSTSNPPHERVPVPSGGPPSPLAGTLNRLREIEELGANWDSYGSEAPDRVAVEKARSLIREVNVESVNSARGAAVPYSVVPLSGGGVQVEWRGDAATIEVEIGSEGVLGYLLARGSEPSREFEEADNVSQARILQLVRDVI